jgi:RNA polymerase primary sigma factor
LEDPLKHRGLASEVAWKYRGAGMANGLDLEDLRQEGFIGLMRACELFNEARGIEFSTYAYYWIRSEILKAINDQAHPIRIPKRARTDVGKGVSLDDPTLKPGRRDCIQAALWVLNAERDDDELGSLVQANNVETQDEFAVIAPRLETLDSRDRAIIDMRFGLDGAEPLSRQQIGQKLKLTRERIRQLEDKALARLREPA